MSTPPDRVEVYLEVIKRLEPDITMIDRDAAMASIAVSLKRIADIQYEQLIILQNWWQNVVGRSLP
jgi:hypothetical protein